MDRTHRPSSDVHCRADSQSRSAPNTRRVHVRIRQAAALHRPQVSIRTCPRGRSQAKNTETQQKSPHSSRDPIHPSPPLHKLQESKQRTTTRPLYNHIHNTQHIDISYCYMSYYLITTGQRTPASHSTSCRWAWRHNDDARTRLAVKRHILETKIFERSLLRVVEDR